MKPSRKENKLIAAAAAVTLCYSCSCNPVLQAQFHSQQLVMEKQVAARRVHFTGCLRKVH